MNIFTAMKYCCILHGRVCVMRYFFQCFIFHENCIVENLLKMAYYQKYITTFERQIYICINTAIKSRVESNNLVVFERYSLKNEQ